MTKYQFITRKCLIERKHVKTYLIKTKFRKLGPKFLLWAPVSQNIKLAISTSS